MGERRAVVRPGRTIAAQIGRVILSFILATLLVYGVAFPPKVAYAAAFPEGSTGTVYVMQWGTGLDYYTAEVPPGSEGTILLTANQSMTSGDAFDLQFVGFNADISTTNRYEINAIGFRIADGYIYGLNQFNNHLMKIGNISGSGNELIDLGLVTNLPASGATTYNSGTFGGPGINGVDYSDTLFVRSGLTDGNTTDGQGTPWNQLLRAIPITSAVADGSTPAVSQRIVLSQPVYNTADLVFVDGYLWGVDEKSTPNGGFNPVIYRITPNATPGAVWQVDKYSLAGLGIKTETGAAAGFGAQWVYGNGNIGILGNNSATISQIKIINPTAATPTFQLVSWVTNNAFTTNNNDGTSYPGMPIDLGLTKTADVSYIPGDPLTYTIQVTNEETDPTAISSGFYIEDTIPDGFLPTYTVTVDRATPADTSDDDTFTITESSPGVFTTTSSTADPSVATVETNPSGVNVLTYSGGQLDPGAVFTLTLTGTTSTTTPVALHNSATVTGNEYDPNPDNNTDTTDTVPIAAADDYYEMYVGQTLAVDSTRNVLTNDTGDDPANPADTNALPRVITLTTLTTDQGGTATLYSDGTFTYIPPTNNYSGLDSFNYSITTNHLATAGPGGAPITASAQVKILVKPIAEPDSAITPVNTPVKIPALNNDRGTILKAPATWISYTTPTHGTLSKSPDGTVIYTPNLNYSGPDYFEYTIQDTNSQQTSTHVNIMVTPLAADDYNKTVVDTPVSGQVLPNDKGTVLQVTDYGQPSHGTVVVNPDGSYTYTPAPGFVGRDSFPYTAIDSFGQTTPAMVYIDVTPLPTLPPTGDSTGWIALGIVIACLVAGLALLLVRPVRRRLGF